MDGALWEKILVPLLVAAIGVVVAYVTARIGKRGDRENHMIDQLQEDRDADRRQMAEMRQHQAQTDTRLAQLETEVRILRTRDNLWEIHSTRVEAQVEGLGGTPHPRPLGLRDGA